MAVQHPELAHLLMAIPNSAGFPFVPRDIVAKLVAYLKREGLRKGAPDLLFAYPCHGYAGLWIEMKNAGVGYGKVTPEQRFYLAELAAVGYKTCWCAGADAAIAAITDYLTPATDKRLP